jgi:hypothetical protein
MILEIVIPDEAEIKAMADIEKGVMVDLSREKCTALDNVISQCYKARQRRLAETLEQTFITSVYNYKTVQRLARGRFPDKTTETQAQQIIRCVGLSLLNASILDAIKAEKDANEADAAQV